MVRVPEDLRIRALDILATSSDEPLKTNAFAKHVQSLLEREMAEQANPRLLQKRALAGSLLEDLVAPRKRTPGRKFDGEYSPSTCG